MAKKPAKATKATKPEDEHRFSFPHQPTGDTTHDRLFAVAPDGSSHVRKHTTQSVIAERTIVVDPETSRRVTFVEIEFRNGGTKRRALLHGVPAHAYMMTEYPADWTKMEWPQLARALGTARSLTGAMLRG